MQQPFGWEFIDRKDASTSATIDFDFPSGFSSFKVEVIGVVPATDNVDFYSRLSDDAGLTFEADASDYAHTVEAREAGVGDVSGTNNSDTEINLTGDGAGSTMGSDTGEDGSFTIVISNPLSATLATKLRWHGAIESDGGALVNIIGSGMIHAVAANDAIRFLMSSGNIESGTFVLFGLNVPSS